jgi:hypothetical protein
MSYSNPRLITPPREEEEVYPYRRAWRSVAIESGILLGLMLVSYVLVNFLGVSVPENSRLALNIVLALLPAVLWFIFSRWPEDRALEPRRRLATTFFVSALVANAIGIPLLNDFIQPASWLSMESTLTRILGYMATVAVVQEVLKYIVLRYIVWPDYYRTRTDSVAYGAAGAIGYAVVVNLHFVGANPDANIDSMTLQVFAITSLHLVGSMYIAYGLSETLFSSALSFLMPGMLVAGTFINGIALAMRPTFLNATLGLTLSEQRTIFGLLFSIILYTGSMMVIIFLFNVAERREKDRLSSQET